MQVKELDLFPLIKNRDNGVSLKDDWIVVSRINANPVPTLEVTEFPTGFNYFMVLISGWGKITATTNGYMYSGGRKVPVIFFSKDNPINSMYYLVTPITPPKGIDGALTKLTIAFENEMGASPIKIYRKGYFVEDYFKIGEKKEFDVLGTAAVFGVSTIAGFVVGRFVNIP